MDLTFTIATLNKGGAERVLSSLANKFSKNGHNVRIIYMHPHKIAYPINENISIDCMNVENFNSEHKFFKKVILFFKRVLILRKKIKNQPTDVIISFGDSISVTMLLATLFLSTKKIIKIISVRNNPALNAGTYVRAFASFLYQSADAVVVQTAYAERVLKSINKNLSFIQINNPVKIIHKSNPYTLSKKNFTFLSLGRYYKRKRHDLLIDAFNTLSKKNKNISLCIAGKDDGCKSSLQNLIYDLELQDKVVLKDAVDDVYDLIHKSEIYVHPSDFEGMPNAVLEAMSCGLPCVVSNFDGVDNIITDQSEGVLFKVNDKNSLVEQMQIVLDNLELRQKLSNNSFESILKNFDFDIIYKQWLDLINKLKLK
tara:strand:+ start:1228 stop:2337 length:1110 start_codon:yes stop_codon:yes gene_type:complete